MIEKILICFLLILNKSISSSIIKKSINLTNLEINDTKLVYNADNKINNSISNKLLEKNGHLINLKIDNKIEPKINDEEKSFFETKFLIFDKSNLTEGDNPVEQLKCLEKKVKRFDQLCERYHANQANCTNLNYHIKRLPNFECVLLKAKVNNPNILLDQYEITCDHPSNSLEYYRPNSCSLIYNLVKGKNFNKMDDDYINWTVFWIIIGFLIGFCLFVCCCIPNKYCCSNCTAEKKFDFFGDCMAKACMNCKT